ncbi:hypothetical protein [Nocardia terpenica]|uniref:hypothetical protein n=1 Tax=Nocardia terpenica TaxID=455432 RepID=UPI00031A8E18|nr:hypothetical protein [Nocardia terpenica]NQE91190.1 hypothetical protein [Nocardia terpenica]
MSEQRIGFRKYVGDLIDSAKDTMDASKDCADDILDRTYGVERGLRNTVRAVFGRDKKP